VDQALIDRIVANVLEQLQPATPRAVTPATTATRPSAVQLTQAVITADVLNKAVSPGQAVQIGTRSLLTPSARDWLRQHQIMWSRAAGNSDARVDRAASLRGQLLLSTVTPAVRGAVDSLFRSVRHWQRQVVGPARDAAEIAVRSLATAECDRVLITSREAELVACLANRQAAVRAAVVSSADHVQRLEASLSPNLWVVDPTAKSLMELRNLFRSCVALGKPQPKEV
jgi:hypothetical protein